MALAKATGKAESIGATIGTIGLVGFIGVLGYQTYEWLRSAMWPQINWHTVFRLMEIEAPKPDWLGLQVVVNWLFDLSLAWTFVFLLVLGLVWGVIADLHTR